MNDITLVQLYCLKHITQNKGCTLTELSEFTDMKMPALSRLIKRMVLKGIVNRIPNPKDKRQTKLYSAMNTDDIQQELKGLFN